ncbi:MAG TPA: phosphopantetheine-binding protein [Bryobacteraceae bacterium]|nr:phosphopantetheine-binding protein [Bryobacteraceae bacterium]
MFEDLSQRVISVIAATQHIEASKILEESSFAELGIDSLDGINILFALENEFNINIPDDEAQTIRTVQDAISGVRKLLERGDEGTPVAVRA